MLETVLRERGLDYRTGKAWTTDAIFRETVDRRDRRVAEGCSIVEMEAAALFAVAQFRGVTLGQVVYGGDLVVPEGWDKRGWYDRTSDRELMFWLAVEACGRLELTCHVSCVSRNHLPGAQCTICNSFRQLKIRAMLINFVHANCKIALHY